MVDNAVAVVSDPAMTRTLACAMSHSSDIFWAEAFSESRLEKKSVRVILAWAATRLRTCSLEYWRKRSTFRLKFSGMERRMKGQQSGSFRPTSKRVITKAASWMVLTQK